MASETRARARFEKQVRIRFDSCDPSGTVFYPHYFVLFNGLVEDWITDGLGISYAELIGPRRTGLPTVSLQSEFRAISRIGDQVTLGLQVDKLGSRSLGLALDCHAGAVERVRVRQVIVTTHLETHRSIAIPPDLREAIERFGYVS